MIRRQAPSRRTAALDERHLQGQGGQLEPREMALLAGSHHPLAEGYRAARALFDSLTHFAGCQSRLLAYADEAHHVALTAPALTLGWDPHGVPGFHREVLPGAEEWPAYVAAAIAAGLPAGTHPNGHLGRWEIAVSDPDWEALVREALRRRDVTWRPVNGRACLRCFDHDRFTRIHDALTEAVRDWLLPPRDGMAPPPTAEPRTGRGSAPPDGSALIRPSPPAGRSLPSPEAAVTQMSLL